MNLEGMNMTEFDTLRAKLDAAAAAGDILAQVGLEPTFAVSSYVPLMTVPALGDAAVRVATTTIGQMTLTPPRLCKDGPRERTKIETAEGGFHPFTPEAATPEAASTALGQEEPALRVTSVEAPRQAAGEEPAACDQPAPASEPPPGLVSDTLKPAAYTEAETQWAITTFLDLTEGGTSQEAAVKIIAAQLNRTSEAIKNRLYTAWKRRLQDERDARAKVRAKPVAVQPVAISPKAAPAPAPEPEAPATSIYEDELVQRVTAQKLPHGWDYGADRRMLLLAVGGLDAATIATNLEVVPKLVKSRLAQLTDNGRIDAAELLRAVTAILAEQRKGVAA